MFLIFAYLIVAVFLYFLALWCMNRHVRFKSLKRFPGAPPTFLFGNIEWVVKLYSRTKQLDFPPAVYIVDRILGGSVLYTNGMYAFWFGTKPVVTIYQAEIMEKVLTSTISIEKTFEYSFLHKWLGTGLLTSTGDKWRTRRKLLTPSFHFRILEDFFPVFNQQAMVLVDKLKTVSGKEYVDIAPLIILCTLDVICETVMGVSIGAQRGENLQYVEAIHNLADFFNKRMVQPWLWTDCLFGLTKIGRQYNAYIKVLHDFTDKVIKEKKEALLRNEWVKDEMKNEDEYYTKKRRTFMDLLLDMHVRNQSLSEEDIREEVDTFMFEGHDTTAMGIMFTLYCIGLHPEVQEKVVKELDDIFGNDTERPVTHSDTRNMKYLECVIKESQRLFPPVPIIGRIAKENIHYDGLEIPKDTTLHINILCLHRNPEHFPNPEVFDPDRFIAEKSINRHPYAFVPFSAGPRNCIGQKFAMLEEKTIISTLLRHFNVVSLDPRDRFHVKIEFTLRPAQEVRLKLVPRQH